MPVTLAPRPWESGWLGKSAFALELTPPWPDPDALTDALEALPRPNFVSLRIPATAFEPRALVSACGFLLIETYMVLERPVDPAASPQPRVRLATPDDADALAAVAADSFASDRFHRDPAIPTAVADHSRALWLRNAITDPGKQVIVAGDPVDPEARAGFLIARGGHGCHVLDLMAVARDHRRRGIGRALTDHFFYLARAAGATRAQVGTQDVNAASLNLYIGAGFRHAEARYTFHRHGGAR
ncbi:MAG: GNAT family N-acetyltransferase [Myxococcales bacterium]|nr:GNAT family N-acetyltransferase [Myxococcales bacterium]